MGHDEAVSPVIGTLLILATFSVVVASVLMIGRPQIVEYQEQGEFQAVLNQMGRVASDASQISISGKTNEVRQPTLKISSGDIRVERGHHVAVSIGYIALNYSDAPAQPHDPGHHPGFYVRAADLTGIGGPDFGPDWDAKDQAIELVYLDKDHAGGGGRKMFARLAFWDGSEWKTTVSSTGSVNVNDGGALPAMPFVDTAGKIANLSDGPWRIRVFHDTTLGGDVLIGEVYLYDLTRLKYHFSGESGPRSAYLENGAVFSTERNQHRLVREGLLSAPRDGLGGTALTVRAAILEDDGASASGRTEVGFLMRVLDTEHWVERGGAIVTRLQLSGPYPALWYDHLDNVGYLADADPARGVYYVDTAANAGKHSTYPLNVVFTQIDLRMRQG